MPRARDAVDDSTIEASPIAETQIANEVHELVDHSGDLPHDADEVWFEADQLAASSTVDLRPVDPLARAPNLEALATAIASPGISLATLPGWPDAGATGQGLGAIADELIGELRPGDLVVVCASQRGVGRTSLLAQLGDGLALAGSSVVFVGADAPKLWRARTLARFFGVDARIFVDANEARREPNFAAMLAAFAAGPWAAIDSRQRFVSADMFGDPARRAGVIASLRRWQHELGEGASVVIVDPVEHLGELSPTLAELAVLAAAEGLIILASCDLAQPDPAAARAIDSSASVRLRAAAEDEHTLALELCHRRLGPRGRGLLRWHRPSGRFDGSR
jgi:hypothetical protein